MKYLKLAILAVLAFIGLNKMHSAEAKMNTVNHANPSDTRPTGGHTECF